jgi:hypothetical protein
LVYIYRIYLHYSLIRSFTKFYDNFLPDLRFTQFQATILDKTLETIAANITKILNIDKTNFVSPSPPSSLLWTTPKQLLHGNIPWYKLNIELGERGFKNGSMIQHGVYHKNTRIFYRRKIVSTSYVQDCLNVGILHAYQLFESYG